MRCIRIRQKPSILKLERGSAGVVEMSFVLPMALIVVISLVYLIFSMFLYVHLQGLAEVAADSLENELIEALKSVESTPFSEKIEISAESEEKIRADFDDRLQNLCVLPGMSVNFVFEIEMKVVNPEINVYMECFCFKGEIFTASVERKVYFPKEFASNLDLILDVSDETGALIYAKEKLEKVREAYEKVF